MKPPFRSLTSILASGLFLTLSFLSVSCGKKEEPSGSSSSSIRASESPRVTAARRHFMTTCPALNEEAARNLTQTVESWITAGEMNSYLLQTEGGSAAAKKHGEQAALLAAAINKMCEDTASLTPQGKTKRDYWEARSWSGYLLPEDFTNGEYPDTSALYTGPDAARLTECDAAFLKKQEALLKPLRDETKALAAATDSTMKKRYGPGTPPPDPAGKDAFMDEMRALTANHTAAAARLRTASLDAAKLLAEWRFKDWQGYTGSDPPGTGGGGAASVSPQSKTPATPLQARADFYARIRARLKLLERELEIKRQIRGVERAALMQNQPDPNKDHKAYVEFWRNVRGRRWEAVWEGDVRGLLISYWKNDAGRWEALKWAGYIIPDTPPEYAAVGPPPAPESR